MTSFKNIFGEIVAEVEERSNKVEAEKFVDFYNKNAESEREEIAEVDFHDGRFLFIN